MELKAGGYQYHKTCYISHLSTRPFKFSPYLWTPKRPRCYGHGKSRLGATAARKIRVQREDFLASLLSHLISWYRAKFVDILELAIGPSQKHARESWVQGMESLQARIAAHDLTCELKVGRQ